MPWARLRHENSEIGIFSGTLVQNSDFGISVSGTALFFVYSGAIVEEEMT